MSPEQESKIGFLMSQAGVGRETAIVALTHCRWNLSHARDYLTGEICQKIAFRQANEFFR